MDFTKAVNTSDKDKRNRLIQVEIDNEFWPEHLGDGCPRGGFADDVSVENIKIEEDHNSLVVTFGISYNESLPTSCQDINVPFGMYANCEVTINKGARVYEIDFDFEDRDVTPSDFY